MKRNKFFFLIVTILIVAVAAVGCGQNRQSSLEGAKTAEGTNAAPTKSATGTSTSGLEPYKFTHYFNYEWWGLKPWGEDAVSKVLKEKFNVHIEFSKPDSDPQAKLNVMISAGDLPDSIMMDRGVDNRKLAELGLLQPLEPFMAKNPTLQQNLLPTTMEMLKIKGKLYGIPNWPRKAATGGNDAWIYNGRLFKDAGSPKLETLDDLYNYALKIKKDIPKNREGLPTIPVMFDYSTDGQKLGLAFYRSFGGVIANNWYTVKAGKYQLAFRDPVYKQASMELNKWWRAGLLSETQFSDTKEQILEKIVAGRTALLYYDQSANESNKFRRILMESFPDDTYEMVKPFPYPPANGLPVSKIYPDFKETVGWNVTCISKNAKNPQRIYDLWSYLLTQEACILQMYGPKGELWSTLNEKGLPILKKSESELTTEEINRLGLWFWMIPGHSDHVDNTKFAVNAMQPKEKQNWVINNQANILTPIMWISDEFVGINEVIDSKSNEGIKRTLCEDYIKAQYPKVIMASSAAEAEKIYNGIIDFCDKNGMPAVEALYDKKYKENVALVGTGLKK